MSKNPRGLPNNFQIDVPTQLATPVKLDEFIDDELARARTARVPKDETTPVVPPTPAPVVVRPPEIVAEEPPPVAPRAAVVAPEEPPVRRPPRQVRHIESPPVLRPRFRQAALSPSKPLRVQLNMTPAVSKMLNDIVGHFRTYCVQKDTTPSEIFEALVSTLHEARVELNLANVPPRGQWGSASANAFRTQIRDAITQAVVTHYTPASE